jgi:hypothetical protein
MFEPQVCPSCFLIRNAADFVSYVRGHNKLVFSSICIYCLGENTHPNPLSYNQCRARRVVALQNNRTRQLGLISDLTIEQWIELLERSQGCCAYCQIYIGKENLVLDHIVPVTKGGGTTMSNVTPACRECNLSKKGMTLEEWKSRMAQIVQ